MPIITISSDAYSHGKIISEKVAEALAYDCIGPEIIQHACEAMGVSQADLQKALFDSPTFIERFSTKKEQCLALFRTAFFRYMCRDNLVYHGVAGHIFMEGVPNVIKVRIIADFNTRVREKMVSEGLTFEAAERGLTKEDNKRAKWTRFLYGKDNNDPKLYDIFLNLNNIDEDAAVAIITGTTQVSTNGHHDMMRKMLKDLAMAAEAEARLLTLFPEVEAVARDGELFVSVQGSILQQQLIADKARQIISQIEGVRNARIGVAPSIYVPF